MARWYHSSAAAMSQEETFRLSPSSPTGGAHVNADGEREQDENGNAAIHSRKSLSSNCRSGESPQAQKRLSRLSHCAIGLG